MNEDRYYIDIKLNNQDWFEAPTIRVKGAYKLEDVDSIIQQYKSIGISTIANHMLKLKRSNMNVIEFQTIHQGIRDWLESLNLKYENDSQFALKATLLYNLIAGNDSYKEPIVHDFASYNYNEHEFWNYYESFIEAPAGYLHYVDNYRFYGINSKYDDLFRYTLDAMNIKTTNEYLTRQYDTKLKITSSSESRVVLSGSYNNNSKNPVIHQEVYRVSAKVTPIYERRTGIYNQIIYHQWWSHTHQRWIKGNIHSIKPVVRTFLYLIRIDYEFYGTVPKILSTQSGYLTYDGVELDLDSILPLSSEELEYNFPTKARLQEYCNQNNLDMIAVVPERTTRSLTDQTLYYYNGPNNRVEPIYFQTRFKINQYQLFHKVELDDKYFKVSKAPKFAIFEN